MRFFIELSYHGKSYFGWQRQPNQISIQETLENSFSTLLRTSIEILGAGRTDTGVHAKKMIAHFDFDSKFPEDFLPRINSFLPKDISIHQIYPVKSDAHARFDALERTYDYHVQLGKNPFNAELTWQVHYDLDMEKMNEAAILLVGKKDFSSFAKLHTDVKTHICEIKYAKWEKEKDELKFTITADRFLRNMVRAIVGTLVDVGRNKISLEEFNKIIERKERRFASASAPAQGLFLADVVYPKSLFLHE